MPCDMIMRCQFDLPWRECIGKVRAECSSSADLAFSLLKDHQTANDALTTQQTALQESQRQVAAVPCLHCALLQTR